MIDFSEKFDLIIVNCQEVYFLRLKKIGEEFKIFQSEKFEASIYEQQVFNFDNLERVLENIASKYRTRVVGVILNLPIFLFQKEIINRSLVSSSGIFNYLKTVFPLPLEKYSFSYEEDKYRIGSSLSILNIYFVNKDIITKIINIFQFKQIIPLFITPSNTVYFRYLLDNAIINFEDDYLVFILEKNSILVMLIKKLKIEKMIWEESTSGADYQFLISRYYGFFKTDLDPEGKVLLFSWEKIRPIENISHSQIIQEKSPEAIIVEGSFLILNQILKGKKVLDFLPLKTSLAYFLNRLPSILIMLVVFLTLLAFFFSFSFLTLSFRLDKEKKYIEKQISSQVSISDLSSKINDFLNIKNYLDENNLKKWQLLVSLVNIDSLDEVKLSSGSNLSFSLKVKTEDILSVKDFISQNFPEARLIQEEPVSSNELKITYSF